MLPSARASANTLPPDDDAGRPVSVAAFDRLLGDPPCLAAAMDYLGRGWSAIALCPPDHVGCTAAHVARCTNPGKGPLIRWAEYQRRRPTEVEVRGWFRAWPAANVGVVCGSVSGLAMLDIDGRAGYGLF